MTLNEISDKPAKPVVVFPNSGQTKARNMESQNTYINEPFKNSTVPRSSTIPPEIKGNMVRAVVA
ncbi:MAG: hypothetical protein OEY64_11740 [Nitrospinota bacterium]|nr:hypothetical protein [Nitrospinota bacterium]